MFKSHRFKPKTKINPNKLDEVEKQAKNSGTLTENQYTYWHIKPIDQRFKFVCAHLEVSLFLKKINK